MVELHAPTLKNDFGIEPTTAPYTMQQAQGPEVIIDLSHDGDDGHEDDDDDEEKQEEGEEVFMTSSGNIGRARSVGV